MIFAEPPVDIGRDQAAAEAAKELSKAAYRESGGSLLERAIGKVLEWIGDLLDSLTGTSPKGHAGLAMLIGLVVLIIVVVLWRAGVLRTSHKVSSHAVFDTARPRTAAEYRTQSEQEAARENGVRGGGGRRPGRADTAGALAAGGTGLHGGCLRQPSRDA